MTQRNTVLPGRLFLYLHRYPLRIYSLRSCGFSCRALIGENRALDSYSDRQSRLLEWRRSIAKLGVTTKQICSGTRQAQPSFFFFFKLLFLKETKTKTSKIRCDILLLLFLLQFTYHASIHGINQESYVESIGCMLLYLQ